MSVPSRIEKRFAALEEAGRGGLVVFVTAGDPDASTSAEILSALPRSGADIIELGMPFSDPMADGPVIQMSSQRALGNGASLRKTLAMVEEFRRGDDETPIILMGYFNPIYVYGTDAFAAEAKAAGADGLIVVDLPHEEEHELGAPARAAGLDLIHLATPTLGDERLPLVLEGASGFLYYVSIAGITGTASATAADIGRAVERLRRHTELPIAVGFGIKTPDQVASVAAVADAAVVGSALVGKIAENLDADGAPRPGLVAAVLTFVSDLAEGARRAARKP
ncbi:MAG: tryptophan synthase subunit alpha [Rhodospirillales bacterium]|nr:tryptophan synthase subunit alpha [Rhodospirillales bacterium]MDP6772773.1 tryptophan synthase subunit alpha [Rhodospirillales bacterium]